MDSSIVRKRPAIRTSDEHDSDAHDSDAHDSDEHDNEPDRERDTLPPTDGHRLPLLNDDETVGLVSVLFHAQQGVSAAHCAIDGARDANDAALVEFLEATEPQHA